MPALTISFLLFLPFVLNKNIARFESLSTT